MTAARFALAALLATAAGLGLVTRLSREPRSAPGLLGLSFFSGVLGGGLWTCLLLVARIPVGWASVAAGLLLMAAWIRPGAVRAAVWRRPPAAAWLMAPAALFLAWGAFSSDFPGHDASTFYSLKAKSIVHHGTIWNEDFLDPARIHQAHRRPLLLPAIYANHWILTGAGEGRWLRLWFALLQVGAALAAYDVLRARCSRGAAGAGAAFLLLVPNLWRDSGSAVTAYADAPLSMIIALALGSGGPLASFLLCAGCWLKDEGTAFVLPFALLHGWRLAAAPALLGAGWMLFARLLPPDIDYLPHNFLSPHLESLPLILKHVGREFLSIRTWSALWLAVAACLVVHRRILDRTDARWLLPLALQLCIYLAVWCTFPVDRVEFMVRVEVRRLVSHLAAAAWLWAVWRWDRGVGRPEPLIP